MKTFGMLFVLLLGLSSLLWAAPAPILTDADESAAQAEIESISAQIQALQENGEEAPATLMERMTELEQLVFARHHDMSSLDVLGESCATAISITSADPIAFCEAGLMGETEDCNLNGTTPTVATYRDIFYSFVPLTNGIYVVTTCGSVGNTSLNIWAGTCCSGTRLTVDNDSCGGLDARRRVTLSAGTTYYFEIGYTTSGQVAAAYNFNLTGPINPAPLAPGNDLCSGATAVGSLPATVTGDNWGATSDGGLPACGGVPTDSLFGGVWYTVVGNGTFLTATTNHYCTTFNTIIKVFRGSCGGLICVINNEDISTGDGISQSSVSWCSDVGVTYYIGVGVGGATAAVARQDKYRGPFTLVVTAGDLCACEAFTLCGGPLTEGAASNNTCATFDATVLHCGETIYGLHCPEPDSDFYKIIVPAGQAMTIALYDGATCSTNPPTKVWSRMYTASCATSGAASAANKLVNRTAFATDTTVYVLVLDAGTTAPVNRMTYKLVTTCQGVPGNDLCANAQLVGVPSSTNGTITYGTVDAVAACTATPTLPGVWYKIAGNGHSVAVDACISSFDNTINVYRGPDCAHLVCHGGDLESCDSPNGAGAKYTFCTTAGETYWVLVHSASGSTGTFTLTTADLGECAQNDSCSGAIPVGVPSVTNGTTVGYTQGSPLEPTCSYNANSPSVWYKVIGNDHTLTADLCANVVDFDSRIAVYRGTCDNLVCVIGSDGGCPNGFSASVSWCSEAGVEYFILVFGWPGYFGPFTLTITDGACCVFTDYCANPIVMPHEFSFTNTANSCCATNPIANLGGCSGYNSVSGRDVIYQFTLLTNGVVSFTCSGPLDNQLMVFSSCANPVGTCLAAADQFGAGVAESISNLGLAQGTYYVSTSAAGAACGSLTLSAAGDVPLPVTMLLSEAIPGDASIRLHWVTASEFDNDRFEIVRAGVVMSRVRSQGNGPVGHDYSWIEDNLVNGTRYEYLLRSVSLGGAVADLATLSAVPSMSAATITEYALHQNYPNPFNPTTSLMFDLVEGGQVTLRVYNLMGQEVAMVVNGQMAAGRHTVTLDASGLPAGIYIYRMVANGFSAEKKMLLLK